MIIDFYVMEGAGRMQAWRELCLLLEVPYAAQQPVYVHAATTDDAEQLDQLLWTYRDDSFLAHQISATTNTELAPIEIGTSTPLRKEGILVNLSKQIPDFYRDFNRIIEIVFDEPVVQQAARERFRQYREQGCELNTHKIKVKQA